MFLQPLKYMNTLTLKKYIQGYWVLLKQSVLLLTNPDFLSCNVGKFPYFNFCLIDHIKSCKTDIPGFNPFTVLFHKTKPPQKEPKTAYPYFNTKGSAVRSSDKKDSSIKSKEQRRKSLAEVTSSRKTSESSERPPKKVERSTSGSSTKGDVRSSVTSSQSSTSDIRQNVKKTLLVSISNNSQ